MSAIKKGDLVVIVTAKLCGCTNNIGQVMTITRTTISRLGGRCCQCGALTFRTGTPIASNGDDIWHEFARLKKIDPPAISETEGAPIRIKEAA